MKEQLVQYVNLLFAGTRGSEDIKQEILQNTLDRYDDLIAEGKSPEAAYRLAIIGIGDINEILGASGGAAGSVPASQAFAENKGKTDTPTKKLLRAIGIALYILCPTPLLVLDTLGMDELGVCGLLAMVAVATALVILGGRRQVPDGTAGSYDAPARAQSELEKSVSSLVWTIGLATYFIVSFATGAWHITWVIFLLTGAVSGLVKAILDLKGDLNS